MPFKVQVGPPQIAIHQAKYKYLFWRPFTAITTGSINQDPTWTSFQVAPQHPSTPVATAGRSARSRASSRVWSGGGRPCRSR